MRIELTLPPLVLASASPRRQQLLREAGFTFSVQPSHADESFDPELPHTEVPQVLARRKAEALSEISAHSLVIAADTVVILGNDLLNKPTDAAEARHMLSRLASHTHTVVTGVCLSFQSHLHIFAEHTRVTFAPLTAAEIEFYVETFSPLDKAGAYGVQDYIGLRAVSHLDGDFYNVMGLPMSRLVKELTTFAASLAR